MKEPEPFRTYTASEARAMRKEIEKRDRPKKAKKKPEKSAHTKALDKADMWYSRWFRADQADEQGAVTCATCGRWMLWKMPDGSCHCGHFESRGLSAVRFMPENCGTQCKICNTYQEGRKPDFEIYLRKKHGDKVVDNIKALAKLPNKRLSDFELEAIAMEYKRKYEIIVKQKGL
jgi:hypothetical protein